MLVNVKNAFLLKLNENVNIGVYFFLKDNILFSGLNLKDSLKEKLKKILNVKEIVTVKISGTPYTGLFLLDYNFNDDSFVIVPKNIFDSERKIIEKYFKTVTFNTEMTVLKNNIILKDNKALIPKDSDVFLEEDLKKINVNFEKVFLEDFESIGSLVVFSKDKNTGIIGVEDENFKSKVESFFNVKLHFTTVNNNSPFLNSGLILGEGIVLGEDTMPLETQIILENL